MKRFTVTGMSCAACSARVEKSVSGVEGVEACSVNLLTGAMSVEGVASAEDIISAVEAAGYGASLKDGENKAQPEKKLEALKDKETPRLVARLVSSLVFLLALMYVSMGHVMWGWYLPEALADNPLAVALLEMILSASVMIINQRFFINGFKGLIKGAPNMDTLVAIGSSSAFVYSTAVLFAMTAGGDAAHYLHELYFESAAMILALITVGKMLESRAKGKTTDALKSLMELAPAKALIIKDGAEVEIDVDKVKVGDIFIVKAGDKISVDGTVVEGEGTVNESALTGESAPVDKKVGDRVSAATVNQSGYLKCRAERVGEDTTLSQIIRMVSNAASTKAPIAKIADKVAGIFVPTVMAIALISALVWLFSDAEIGFALARGISVLVISCPCALGLATPVAIMVGSGIGAKKGILFKTAAALEETGRIRTVVLDKTGTITKGKPDVTDIILSSTVSVDELLSVARALEEKSEHPLARAVIEYCNANEIKISSKAEDFKTLAGNGVEGRVDGERAVGGSLAFVQSVVFVSDEMKDAINSKSREGKTPLLFSKNDKLLGVIFVADTLTDDSAPAISELHKMGCEVIMLTGDNQYTAEAIGRAAGVDRVIAGVLPEGKADAVAELQSKGKVLMVGDGINDAVALTRANVGMAIGAGTDVAVDSADVVLMNSSLSDVVSAIKLSRATLRKIRQNLFWAFFYNALGIPLAAGVFISWLGWGLSPMFGAAAMSLSSFCVVSNALALNFVNVSAVKAQTVTGVVPSEIKIQAIDNSNGEEKMMKRIVKIEGMMCPHCEARVKKCLEAIDGVEGAAVDHKTDSAELTLSKDIPNELIKKTVEDQGYRVI